MNILVMTEKGQVTIPQAFRKQLNIGKGAPLLAELDASGGIRLVPAMVVPVESYSKARVAEFAKEDTLSKSERARVRKLRDR
jgi:AbrB family looped-hinge helix DNA binding protein